MATIVFLFSLQMSLRFQSPYGTRALLLRYYGIDADNDGTADEPLWSRHALSEKLSVNGPQGNQPVELHAFLFRPNGEDGEGQGQSEEEEEVDRDRKGDREGGGTDRGQGGGVIQKGAGGGDVTSDVIGSEDKSSVVLERGWWGDVGAQGKGAASRLSHEGAASHLENLEDGALGGGYSKVQKV